MKDEKVKPKSIGEELFLVHLRRTSAVPEEDDFDHEATGGDGGDGWP